MAHRGSVSRRRRAVLGFDGAVQQCGLFETVRGHHLGGSCVGQVVRDSHAALCLLHCRIPRVQRRHTAGGVCSVASCNPFMACIGSCFVPRYGECWLRAKCATTQKKAHAAMQRETGAPHNRGCALPVGATDQTQVLRCVRHSPGSSHAPAIALTVHHHAHVRKGGQAMRGDATRSAPNPHFTPYNAERVCSE